MSGSFLPASTTFICLFPGSSDFAPHSGGVGGHFLHWPLPWTIPGDCGRFLSGLRRHSTQLQEGQFLNICQVVPHQYSQAPVAPHCPGNQLPPHGLHPLSDGIPTSPPLGHSSRAHWSAVPRRHHARACLGGGCSCLTDILQVSAQMLLYHRGLP